MLRRYLIEFDTESYDWQTHVSVPRYVGVTAYSVLDALNLMARWLLRSDVWPPISAITVDYDFGKSEFPWGVFSNGVSVWRGLWMPALTLHCGPDDGHKVPNRPNARTSTLEDLAGVRIMTEEQGT